jgi:hypothetical protein
MSVDIEQFEPDGEGSLADVDSAANKMVARLDAV